MMRTSNLPDLAGTTRDVFHRGRLELLQPAGRGHRAGSDALLLAAALPEDASGKLCELGAGAGLAAYAALTANPRLTAVLVEIDPEMAALAGATLELEANRHLAQRAKVLAADATLAGPARSAAGMANNSFDFVIANPPYHLPHERGSPDRLKLLAHRLPRGGLEGWLRTAAAILKPGGMLCLLWRADRLDEAIDAAKGRFGAIDIVPLHAAAERPASRIVVRAVRGSRAPLTILPGVALHGPDNRSTELADALLNGLARLPARRE